jgi:hypothetical protein
VAGTGGPHAACSSSRGCFPAQLRQLLLPAAPHAPSLARSSLSRRLAGPPRDGAAGSTSTAAAGRWTNCRYRTTWGLGEEEERKEGHLTYKWASYFRRSISAFLSSSEHHVAKTVMQNQLGLLSVGFVKLEGLNIRFFNLEVI